jgi:hypothetical protein
MMKVFVSGDTVGRRLQRHTLSFSSHDYHHRRLTRSARDGDDGDDERGEGWVTIKRETINDEAEMRSVLLRRSSSIIVRRRPTLRGGC